MNEHLVKYFLFYFETKTKAIDAGLFKATDIGSWKTQAAVEIKDKARGTIGREEESIVYRRAE